MGKRLLDRTDGRRKGYKPYKATISNRIDPETLAALESMRGTPKPHKKPRRKATR